MPFVPLPDSDTDPHAHPVGFPIATTRQTASYVNTVDDTGSWTAETDHTLVGGYKGVPWGSEARPTLRGHSLRSSVEAALASEAIAPPASAPTVARSAVEPQPPEAPVADTTGFVHAPPPRSRGVLSSLSLLLGGAVLGALALAAFLHLSGISLRTGTMPAAAVSSPCRTEQVRASRLPRSRSDVGHAGAAGE